MVTTVLAADAILVLDDGRIVERGRTASDSQPAVSTTGLYERQFASDAQPVATG